MAGRRAAQGPDKNVAVDVFAKTLGIRATTVRNLASYCTEADPDDRRTPVPASWAYDVFGTGMRPSRNDRADHWPAR